MSHTPQPHRIGFYRSLCKPPMTQQHLAEALGISRNTILTWERDGVASQLGLLQLIRTFMDCGVITDYGTAVQLWKVGGKRLWSEPPELAGLFNKQSESTSTMLEHNQQFEEESFFEQVIAEIPEISQETRQRFSMFQVLLRKSRLPIMIVTLLVVFTLMLVVRPGNTPVLASQRGLIPFATDGQLSPAFAFLQNGSFYSGYEITSATNTLVLTAGPRTNQNANDTSAPVVTFPVAGDFDATVFVSEQFSGPQCCQHVGIGVRSPTDATTWIRITYDYAAILTVNGNRGQEHKLTHNITTSGSLELRVQRSGNKFYFFYREPGNAWASFGEPIEFDLPRDAELFLVVFSAHNDQTSAGAFRDLVVR